MTTHTPSRSFSEYSDFDDSGVAAMRLSDDSSSTSSFSAVEAVDGNPAHLQVHDKRGSHSKKRRRKKRTRRKARKSPQAPFPSASENGRERPPASPGAPGRTVELSRIPRTPEPGVTRTLRIDDDEDGDDLRVDVDERFFDDLDAVLADDVQPELDDDDDELRFDEFEPFSGLSPEPMSRLRLSHAEIEAAHDAARQPHKLPPAVAAPSFSPIGRTRKLLGRIHNELLLFTIMFYFGFCLQRHLVELVYSSFVNAGFVTQDMWYALALVAPVVTFLVIIPNCAFQKRTAPVDPPPTAESTRASASAQSPVRAYLAQPEPVVVDPTRGLAAASTEDDDDESPIALAASGSPDVDDDADDEVDPALHRRSHRRLQKKRRRAHRRRSHRHTSSRVRDGFRFIYSRLRRGTWLAVVFGALVVLCRTLLPFVSSAGDSTYSGFNDDSLHQPLRAQLFLSALGSGAFALWWLSVLAAIGAEPHVTTTRKAMAAANMSRALALTLMLTLVMRVFGASVDVSISPFHPAAARAVGVVLALVALVQLYGFTVRLATHLAVSGENLPATFSAGRIDAYDAVHRRNMSSGSNAVLTDPRAISMGVSGAQRYRRYTAPSSLISLPTLAGFAEPDAPVRYPTRSNSTISSDFSNDSLLLSIHDDTNAPVRVPTLGVYGVRRRTYCGCCRRCWVSIRPTLHVIALSLVLHGVLFIYSFLLTTPAPLLRAVSTHGGEPALSAPSRDTSSLAYISSWQWSGRLLLAGSHALWVLFSLSSRLLSTRGCRRLSTPVLMSSITGVIICAMVAIFWIPQPITSASSTTSLVLSSASSAAQHWMLLVVVLLSPLLLLVAANAAFTLLVIKPSPRQLAGGFVIATLCLVATLYAGILSTHSGLWNLGGFFFTGSSLQGHFWAVLLAAGLIVPLATLTVRLPGKLGKLDGPGDSLWSSMLPTHKKIVVQLTSATVFVLSALLIAGVILSASSTASSPPSPSPSTLKLMLLDVNEGLDRRGVPDWRIFADHVGRVDPDVLILTRSDTARVETGAHDISWFLAEDQAFEHVHSGPFSAAGTLGLSILSRRPLQDTDVVALASVSDRPVGPAVSARTALRGRCVNIIATDLPRRVYADTALSQLYSRQASQLAHLSASYSNRTTDCSGTILLGHFGFGEQDAQHDQLLQASAREGVPLSEAWTRVYPSGQDGSGYGGWSDRAMQRRADTAFVSSGLRVDSVEYLGSGACSTACRPPASAHSSACRRCSAADHLALVLQVSVQ